MLEIEDFSGVIVNKKQLKKITSGAKTEGYHKALNLVLKFTELKEEEQREVMDDNRDDSIVSTVLSRLFAKLQ